MKSQYKALLIILILVLVELFKVYSQTYPNSITTSSDESGSSPQRIARDNVSLLPGFKFIPTSTTQWLGKTDENIVNDVVYQTPPVSQDERDLDLSLTVGTVPSQFDVSPTGAATYSIPIDIATGTAGMQQNLSVVYNSQSGNGILGLGWNLTGLSSITRTPQNNYFDNKVQGVNFSYSDKFALNGSRLILLSGNYGYNNAKYSTEIYDYSEITSYGQTGNGPSYFILITKDGLILEFGNTPDSKVFMTGSQTIVGWNINKITDRFHNYIGFIYKNEDSECVIKEIVYTGNTVENLAPYNSITFHYDNRTIDANVLYHSGSYVNIKKILREIVVKSNNSTVKKYNFIYQNDQLFSKLYKIEVSDKTGNKLNSTIINYGSNDAPFHNYPSSMPDPPHTMSSASEYFSGDFNGDGKSDIIRADFDYINNGNGKFHKTLNLYTRNSEQVDFAYITYIDITHNGDDYNWVSPREKPTPKNGADYMGFFSSDFDGDGADDLLAVNRNLVGGVLEVTDFKIYEYKTGQGFVVQNVAMNTSTSSFNKISPNGNFLTEGDFDGDGNVDFITFLSNGTFFMATIYFPSKGTSYRINDDFTYFWPGAIVEDNQKIIPIDYNGDGKQELMIVYNDFVAQQIGFSCDILEFGGTLISGKMPFTPIYYSGFPTEWHDIANVGDFNGDGKTDLFFNVPDNNPNQWYIAYSKGSSSGFQESTFPYQSYSTTLFSVADFNGDKKSDVAFITPTSSGLTGNLYYSRGINSFKHEQYQDNNFVNSGTGLIIGDFNGDGNYDLLNRVYTNINNNIYYFNIKSTQNFVSKIIDGFNNKVEFIYKPITDNNVYEKCFDIESVSQCFYQFPFWVVSESHTSNAISNNPENDYNTTLFTYKGANYCKEKKAFLGFMQFLSQSSALNKIVVSNFNSYNNNSMLFPYNSEKIDILSGIPISKNTFYYYIKDIINHIIFPYITESHDYDYLTGNQKSTFNTLNYDGNLEKQIIEIGTNSGIDVQTVANYTYDEAGLTIPYKISTSNIATTYYSEVPSPPPFTQTETFDYLPSTGALSHHYKNDVITTYEEYNNFGLPQKVTVSSTGLQNKISRFEYDITGRFVIKETNPANYIITSEYDPVMLTKTHVTDINGQSTSYEYDNFGTLKRIISPEGNETNISSHFITELLIPDALYYSEATATNSPYIKTYFDRLSREILSESTSFNGNKVFVKTEYNNIGQVIGKSLPYFEGTTPILTSYEYYNEGRIKNEFKPTNTTHYNYSGNTIETTISSSGNPDKLFSKTFNAAGNVISATDAGGTINFTYFSSGLPHTVTSNGATTTMEYDSYGQQTSLQEPNSGTTQYHYNAYGELEYQIDANTNRFDMTYDILGRQTTKIGLDGTYTYIYDTETNGKGLIASITGPNGASKSYKYDAMSRLKQINESYLGQTFTTNYQYDNFGNISKIIYPSNFSVIQEYDGNGFLKEIKGGQYLNSIWKLENVNAMGQITSYLNNNHFYTTKTYDTFGFLENITTGTVQNLDFNFNTGTGNLMSRTDNIKNLTENFNVVPYDNLDRLQSMQVTGQQLYFTNYESNGNINSKTDAGTYSYDPTQIHAVTSITGPQNISTLPQVITYNSFNRVSEINEDINKLKFTYGPDDSRIITKLYNSSNNQLIKQKYFAQNYEKELISGQTREWNYINSPDGLVAIYRTVGGADALNYVCKDHLGSIFALVNQNGTIAEEYNYDAWGRRRDPNTWLYTNNLPTLIDRGYTGHEHLDQFSLINMNG
ncbi:MAG: hypothetical protein A2X08_13745, partial [Bacteroidetes bacterium GWA2_32_17]